MAYVEPQVRIYQIFEAVPTSEAQPLHTTIVGPQYDLYLVDPTDPDSDLLLGTYDNTQETTYSWPAGSNIDLDYAELNFVDAKLKYFTDLIGSGQTIAPGTEDNEIEASTLYFIGQAAYPRSAVIPDDVRVGDYAYITDGLGNELLSRIIGYDYDTVVATIGTATAESANQASQMASSSISDTGTPTASDIVATEDATSYDGLADGQLDETYVVEVISTNGVPAGTTMSVTSASGTDDVTSVTPSSWGLPTSIGTRGLTVTFSEAPGGTTGDVAFEEGMQWTVVVEQAYNELTATEGASYTGSFDTTYIVTVTRGGEFGGATPPQVTISTTTGVDGSGPTTVTLGSPVAVGNYGLTVTFTQGTTTTSADGGMVLGDQWTIAVTAAGSGGITILRLADNLSAALQLAADLELNLYRLANVVVPQAQADCTENWEADQDGITVKAGIQVDYTIGTLTGNKVVRDGDMYIEYRALNTSNNDTLLTIETAEQVDDYLGQVHPDNPAAYAAYVARSNSGDVDVFVQTIPTDDLAGYSTGLEQITESRLTWGIVPCSQDLDVINATRSHVLSQSQPGINKFRTAWVSVPLTTTVVVTDENTSGSTLLATITPGANNKSTVVATSVDFVEDGVAVGDTVRYAYTVSGCASATYSTATITRVISGQSLEVSGQITQTPASKIEVWHTMSRSEGAAQIRSASRSLTDTVGRVRNIWPDKVNIGTFTDVPGWALAAIEAGLRAGTYPHQGLTAYPVPMVLASSPRFSYLNSRTLLNTVAGGGTWVVYVDDDGDVINRHQLTTAYDESDPDPNISEDSIIANMDHLSYQLLDVCIIGRANVTESYINQLRHNCNDILRRGMTNSPNNLIGPQVIEGQVVDIARDPLQQNTLEVDIEVDLPDAVNIINLTIKA